MPNRSALPPLPPGPPPATGLVSGLRLGAAPALPKARSRSWALLLVQVLWVLLVFEVDQFVAAKTGVPTNRLPTLIAPFLIWMTLSAGRVRTLYWPLLMFLAMHFVASLLAENSGLARTPFKFMVYITLLMASTAAFMNTPQKLNFVWKTHLLGFAWFAVQGIPTAGRVTWHSVLNNEDSFGPLMVMTIPVAYFYSIMTPSPRWRLVARVVFALGLLGVVVSFARGAAVAAAVVLAHMLFYSPNKTRTFTFLTLATLVTIPLVAYFVPIDQYLVEVGSSAEGDPVRAHLWNLAVRVWHTSPLYGVGASNFGVVAERIATPADHAMIWGSIYYRAVHNTAFQILAEEGVLGILLWAIMVVNFFWWTRQIRSKAAVAVWQGYRSDINLVAWSRGLDGAMVGFLLTSIFYNQLYVHWFWSLLIMAFALHRITVIMPARGDAKTHPKRGTAPGMARA